MMEAVKTIGTMEERNQLVIENERLVDFVLHKYFTNIMFSHDGIAEDMRQVGMLSLFEATRLYNASRSKFSTFAVTKIKNDLHNFVRLDLYRYVNRDNDTSLNAEMGTNEEKVTLGDLIGEYDDYSTSEANDIVEYIKSKGERTYAIVVLLSEGYTYQAIAEQFGISKQRANQMIAKLRKDLIEDFGLSFAEEKVDGQLIAWTEEGFEMTFNNSQEASDTLGVDKYTIRKILKHKKYNAKNTCKKMNDMIVHFKWAK